MMREKRKSMFLRFAAALSTSDYERALRYTQKTWVTEMGERAASSIQRLSIIDWRRVKFLCIVPIRPAICDIKFSIADKTYIIRAVCEKEPYKANEFGRWGFNPGSIRQL